MGNSKRHAAEYRCKPKTKEMILGPVARNKLPLLTTTTTTITDTVDRVTSFKLLGVYIDSTVSWTIQVDNMVK